MKLPRRLLEWSWYLLSTGLLLTIGLVIGAVLTILLFMSRLIGVRALLLTALLLFLAGAGAGVWVWQSHVMPRDLGSTVRSVMVHPGDSFAHVASRLDSAEVINHPLLFRLFARWRELDRRLIPGRYEFSGLRSPEQVLDMLARGEVATLQFTIYEGAPLWKVASIVARTMELDSAAFMRLAGDSDFLSQRSLPFLEGYLFPSTYRFPWGTPLEKIVDDILAIGRNQTDSLWQLPAPDGLSREEVLVLASIVEAEAMLEAEKPIIAAVYLNRLRLRMRLDADPTVIYGLGGLSRPLLRRDLDSITPYNTYRRFGLPPTPINSPGLTAIAAVLRPAVTDYLYFVADGSGGHRFSKTNAEHNRARAEIKRARAAKL